MKLTRPSRLIAVAVMLFSMLFMQLAVAAYACPGLVSTHAQPTQAKAVQGHEAHDAFMSVEMSADGMSDCMAKDPVQPNLCHAHDHAGNQSLDKPAAPAVLPFIPATLVLALVAEDKLDFVGLSQELRQPLTRTTAPPLAIQHCCFRI